MKWLGALFSIFLFSFLYLPMLVLVVLSFNEAKRGSAWLGFSWKWYERLFHNPDLINPFFTSLEIALSSAVLSAFLGLCVGYLIVRGGKFNREAMSWASYLPIMLPEIVLGLSLLSFFVWIGFPLGRMSVLLGHVAFGTAYVAVLVRARLSQADPLLEDAAYDLGSNRRKTFIKVVLPQLTTTLISGMMMVFTLSFDDFIISFFLAGVGVTTLPMKVYSMLKFGVTPEVNALCALILMGSFLLVTTSLLYLRSLDGQRHV